MDTQALPPFKALQAFVAVAQLQSFTQAAESLFVTHSAISQNIKRLESFLGHPLFIRRGHDIELTEQGKLYFPVIRGAIDKIRLATAQQRSLHSDTTLTVNLINSLAMQWLVPRLVNFSDQRSKVDIRLSTLYDNWDFYRDNIDVAILYTTAGQMPDCVYTPLFSAELILVAAKKLKSSAKEIQATLNQNQAIYIEHPMRQHDWQMWCQLNKCRQVAKSKRVWFANSSLGLRAAISGMGLMITQRPFVELELQSGVLKIIGQPCPVEDKAYYLVYPQSKAKLPKVQRWQQWLLQQVT
jgi:LysR family transcriptional regulator, glycine cleavage system transcriptional activator